MESSKSFSPTAIALGSSAIVKVSGQNCFRTLDGSLGQVRVGLPKGSAEGSTKAPPKFHQCSTKLPASFHQGSPSLVVSGFLGQICLGLAKGSTKVSPRFRWVCFTKVPHLSLKRLLFQKRFFLLGSTNCSLHLIPSLILGSKLHELWTCLTHTPPIRRKRPIMSLLLGYSLGLFFRISLGSRSPTTPTANLCPPQI